MNPKDIKPVEEKITDFFKNEITPQQFAQQIRRMNYILTLSIFRMSEQQNTIDMNWAENSFFYLNEFAEILDPVMTKQNP